MDRLSRHRVEDQLRIRLLAEVEHPREVERDPFRGVRAGQDLVRRAGIEYPPMPSGVMSPLGFVEVEIVTGFDEPPDSRLVSTLPVSPETTLMAQGPEGPKVVARS